MHMPLLGDHLHMPLLGDHVDIPEQLEIRSKNGIRKMVYIEFTEDYVVYKLDLIELGGLIVY